MNKLIATLLLVLGVSAVGAETYDVTDTRTFYSNTDTIGVWSAPVGLRAVMDDNFLIITNNNRVVLNFKFDAQTSKSVGSTQYDEITNIIAHEVVTDCDYILCVGRKPDKIVVGWHMLGRNGMNTIFVLRESCYGAECGAPMLYCY